MPYFLFHVKTTRGVTMDEEGSWYPDIRAAESEATAAARELVADCIKSGIYLLPEAIVVTELSGKEVATVHFRDVSLRCRRI